MRDARRDKLNKALEQRLSVVRCAVEAVYHRHNISAILRTCDALGLQHVHLVAGNDPPAPAPARGAERWLDLHFHDTPDEAFAALREAGFKVYVADLDEHGVPPEALPLDEPICLWFGAELVGPSPRARELADGVMTLPMRGLAQSLNVSVAAALSLRAVSERVRVERGDDALLGPTERERVWEAWMERASSSRRDLTQQD